jgi:hypothetical protein
MQSFSKFYENYFQYSEELNPKVWDGFTIKPNIREKLIVIAKDFYDSLELDAKFTDIQLTGSLSNFNYTQYSDFDLHILLDFKDINDDEGLVKQALDGKRFIWNSRHNIMIQGYEVEVYLQDNSEPHIASGLYSLLNDKWLVKPTYDPPHVDERDVSKKAREYEKLIDQLVSKVESAPLGDPINEEYYEYGKRIKDRIQKMRKSGLATGGEFSVENLAFKQLRNSKSIQDLIDATNTAYDKIYSEG